MRIAMSSSVVPVSFLASCEGSVVALLVEPHSFRLARFARISSLYALIRAFSASIFALFRRPHAYLKVVSDTP